MSQRRPATTLLKHYHKAIKVEDITDFIVNVDRSTSQQTYFYDGPIHTQIKEHQYDHYEWMKQMIQYSDIEYKDSIHNFKFHYLFGKQNRKERKVDSLGESRVGKKSYDEVGKPIYRYENLKKIFNFEMINENRRQQRSHMFNEDRTPFSLREIDMLGTEEFEEKFRNRMDFAEMVENQEILDTRSIHYFQHTQNGKPTLTKYLETKNLKVFNLIKFERAIKSGPQSDAIQVDFLCLMEAHKQRLTPKPNFIPSNLYKQPITLNHVLGFALGYFDLGSLMIHMEKRKQIIKTSQRIESENQLEVQLKQIQSKIQMLRRQRHQRKNKQYSHVGTQIQKMISDDPLKDLIFFDGEQAANKIHNLTAIKEQKIKDGCPKSQVYPAIHAEMERVLLALLLSITENQKHLQISSFLWCEDSDQVEEIVLDLIYANFKLLEGRRTKNGVSKMEILNFYARQKIIINSQISYMQKVELEAKKKGELAGKNKSVSPQYPARSPPRRSMMAKSMVAQKSVSELKSRHTSSVNIDLTHRTKLKPNLMSYLSQSVANFKHLKKPK